MPSALDTCAFCGRPRNEVKALVAGPSGARICNNCVTATADILVKASSKEGASTQRTVKRPSEIQEVLDQHVIGQEEAKRTVSVALYQHYKRREVAKSRGPLLVDGEAVTIEKSNILMLGPSGSGKTLIAKTVARMLGLPFYVADASALTQAGYVGADVESMLQGLVADAQGDLEYAKWGVIFLDEFDKLARKSGRSVSGSRDITGEGVQQSLLKMIEGSIVEVPEAGMPKNFGGVGLDTTNILFICAGSFAGIEAVVSRRLNKSVSVGFGSESRVKPSLTDVYRAVDTSDLEEFGLIPEIVGRLPIVTSTYELSESELIDVLVKPKNSICKQFRAIYSLNDIALSFEPDSLVEIARLAKKRPTGARALRAVLEKVLEPYSFMAPDDPSITAIKITAESVHDLGKAPITRKKPKKQAP